MDGSWLYSDKDSQRMKKRRRNGIRYGYVAAALWLGLYLLPLMVFGQALSAYPLEARVAVVGGWAAGLGIYVWAVHYVFIRSSKDTSRYGVTLTESTLNLLGTEIPVPGITRAELAWFASSRTLFVVDYRVNRKGRAKIGTCFLWPSSTENVGELCDKVRELKGWVRQIEKPVYSWGQWKSTRPFPYSGIPIWFPRSVHFDEAFLSERIAFGVIVKAIRWGEIAAVTLYRLPPASFLDRPSHVARLHSAGGSHGDTIPALEEMWLSEKQAAGLRQSLRAKNVPFEEVEVEAGGRALCVPALGWSLLVATM